MIEGIIGALVTLAVLLGAYAIKKPERGKKLIDIIAWVVVSVGLVILAFMLGYYVGTIQINEFTEGKKIDRIKEQAEKRVIIGLGIYVGFALAMMFIKWLSSFLNQPDKKESAQKDNGGE